MQMHLLLIHFFCVRQYSSATRCRRRLYLYQAIRNFAAFLFGLNFENKVSIQFCTKYSEQIPSNEQG